MTTMTVPDRSREQRLDAIKQANYIRTWRSVLKQDIKAGRVSVVDVLRDPAPEVETMAVFDLLLAAPKFGRVKVTKVLSRQAVSPSKTVGGLSPRQRASLVEALSDTEAHQGVSGDAS